ncbi:MAG: hypothetical protein WCY16_01270 [Weeksellaceae bacterium]
MAVLTNISTEFLIVASVIGLILLLTIVWLIYKLNQSEKKRIDSDEKFRQLEGKINQLELQTLESNSIRICSKTY